MLLCLYDLGDRSLFGEEDDVGVATLRVGNKCAAQHSWAPAQATRIRSLRRRVLVGESASSSVVFTYESPVATITKPLVHGFIAQRAATIRYVDHAGNASTRPIEAHYLYYSLPVWYALAWNRLRDDVRSFRVDRIGRIGVTADAFRLQPPERFADSVELEVEPM